MVRTAEDWRKTIPASELTGAWKEVLDDLAELERERGTAETTARANFKAAIETEDKLDALKAQVNEYARTIEDLEQEKFEREKALIARAQKAEAEFAEYRYACDATHLDDITEIRRLKTDLAACEKERDAFKHLLDTCQYGRDINFVRAEKAEAERKRVDALLAQCEEALRFALDPRNCPAITVEAADRIVSALAAICDARQKKAPHA